MTPLRVRASSSVLIESSFFSHPLSRPCPLQALVDTWHAHVEAQPDFVIATTWNDLGEHHYIGPYNFTIWGPLGIGARRIRQTHLTPAVAMRQSPLSALAVTTNAFPHLAYLELSSYFISWYKAPAGSPAPPISPGAERLFYFYNLQPVRNACPGDPVGPPQLNENARYPIEDAAYATVLLGKRWAAAQVAASPPIPSRRPAAASANVTIVSGGGASGVTFLVGPGLQQVQVPALPGAQRFVVSRQGRELVNVTGAERVNTTGSVVDLCNAQTFSGSAAIPWSDSESV